MSTTHWREERSSSARLESETTVAESVAVRIFDEFTGKAMEGVWYVILDIDQRIRPTVVQAGANVTLEDCQDTLYQVIGKAQQLFTCPVSKYARNWIQDSDSQWYTVPDKTKVCNFCYKVDANKTIIVGNLCDKFENILSQLVYASGARPLVGNVLRWVWSKVRSVSQWSPTTIKMHNNLLWVCQVRRLTCDLRITISTTKANQTRMLSTATHSRSSMDLIHSVKFSTSITLWILEVCQSQITFLLRWLTCLDSTTSIHELASSVVQCVFVTKYKSKHSVMEFKVWDARDKATIEGMSSVSFGQSHAEEARRLRAKSALVEGRC